MSKKKLGQFLTPPTLAKFMAKLVLDDKTTSVLDPAVGLGIFLQSLEKISVNRLKYTAYDIDEQMIKAFKKNNLFEVELHKQDYLTNNDFKKYDAIICNPPYNKFQEIDNRKKYISEFKEKYGIKMSGYCNLCVYFLIKSLNELKPTGKCAYIMPYEFLNSGYGVTIKDYLLKDRRIKKIYKFNNKLSLFSDAITTSCIIFFDGSPHDEVKFISIDSIEELYSEKYKNKNSYSFNELDPEEKWNTYFSNSRITYNNLVSFKDIAKVKRGMATGNNSFFSLSPSQLKTYGISNYACVRCISKSADIKTNIFTDEEFLNLEKSDKKVYLFDGCNAKTKTDLDYIKYGEKIKVNSSYLNSHRTPWYILENKEVAPIWVSVFSRGKLKIIRNETSAKNLTTFHGIYVNYYDQDLTNVFFCYLLTPICQRILSENKREYGNGLQKFEPNDLNEAKVLDVSLLSRDDFKKVLSIYGEIKKNELTDNKIEELNTIFLKYI